MISFTFDATERTIFAIDGVFDSNYEKSKKFNEFLGNELKKVDNLCEKELKKVGNCLKVFVENCLEEIDLSSDYTHYRSDKHHDPVKYSNYVLQLVSIKTWKKH